MSFWDTLKDGLEKFSPIEEEKAVSAPVVKTAAPVAQTPLIPEELADTGEVEKTVDSEMGQFIGAPQKVYIPQIDLSKYDTPEIRKENELREGKFQTSLEKLREDYKKAQEDAQSREMKLRMFDAVAKNVGNIVGGAQAMNTKASVTPVKTEGIAVPDLVGRADKNFKTDYDGLLKQYKQLKDGSLTPANRLNAEIANAQLQMSGQRADINSQNQFYGRGMRFGDKSLKEQEKGELTDKQTETISAYKQALASFDKTREMKEGVETGPFQNLRNSLARGVGWDDPKVSRLRAQVAKDLAERIKFLSGTAASDPERKALSITLPGMSDNKDTFNVLLEDAERGIKEAMRIREEEWRIKQGKNVRGYADPDAKAAPPTSGPQGDIVERNGKTYKWNATAGKYQLAQ